MSSKDNINKMKIQVTDRKNAFAKHTPDTGLVCRMYNELSQLNKKTNSSNKKRTNNLNRQSIKRDMWIASKYMKRWSTSLVIRKMQIKTTMTYHYYIVIRAANKTKTDSTKCWARRQSNWNWRHCWWEHKIVQSLWRTVWWCLGKSTISVVIIQSSNPLLGVYTREMKTGAPTKAPNQKQSKHPNELPHNRYSHTIQINSKKNKSICHTILLDGISKAWSWLSERSQSQKAACRVHAGGPYHNVFYQFTSWWISVVFPFFDYKRSC